MNTGMLWLKSHEKPQLDAILEASAYYERKYGMKPDVAFVNPPEHGEYPTPARKKLSAGILARMCITTKARRSAGGRRGLSAFRWSARRSRSYFD